MTPTEPGLYLGLSFIDYYGLGALNASTLEGFARGTPAHARERMIQPPDQTPDLAFGHAFHTFQLEPDRFADLYAVPPDCDKRTKVGKAIWETWTLENPGKMAISAAEFQTYNGMRQSILSHPIAPELLTNPAGASEVTILWRDEHTGLLCKGRLDRIGPLAGWSFVVDLKTTRDASPRSFAADIARYGYHRQLAWYREGLNTLWPGARRAAIVAVEKTPPYCVAVYELDERALEQGAREVRGHVATYWDCVRTGVWPGYDQGLQIIDLPAWAVDHMD